VLSVEELERAQRVFMAELDGIALIVTNAILRPHLARLLQDFGRRVEVLAIEEIPLDVYRVQAVATLGAA
jgi:type III secretion protein V